MKRGSIKIGDKFGRLEVIEFSGKDKNYRNWWLCRCNCGIKRKIRDYTLNSGATQSCGCLRSETTAKTKTKHGKSYTRTYQSWLSMKDRCTNKKNSRWKDYGGRGISIDLVWMEFVKFLEDMGECPEGHSIERKDNSKGYNKENCKWATDIEQARNTRTNKYLTYNGETLCYVAWAEKLGISRNTITNRVRRGLPVEEVLANGKV